MFITIIILTWILLGLIPFLYWNNAWRCSWYRDLGKHEKMEEEMYIFAFLCGVTGVFCYFLILTDLFNKRDKNWYYKNNITGFWYNKKKVERYYNKEESTLLEKQPNTLNYD